MLLKKITIASTLVALSAAADFNNGGHCDTWYYSSGPHTDTIDAATQLIGYFNNPSRNGRLQIGAMGAHSNYRVERLVGFSHAYLDIIDSSKPTDDLDIETSEVTSALELLIGSCTTGQVVLSGGQWEVGIAVENHVGKRRSRASRETRISTPISDADNETISVPLIGKRDIPVDAGLYNYILSMHDTQKVDKVLGASVDSWSDSESNAVDSFSQLVQDTISKAGSSTDDLNIFPSDNPYGAVLNVYNNDWSNGLGFVGGGDNMRKFVKAAVKATADQNTLVTTYSLRERYPDFDVTYGSMRIGITIRRSVVKTGVCNRCQDIAPNPKSYDNTYPQYKPLAGDWDDNVYPTKRNIDGNTWRAWDPNAFGDGNQDPSIAAMLEAVIAGRFQFQYNTLFRTRVTQEPDRMDGIIELVWLMGDSVQAAQNNQAYQGYNPGGRADILFVVHLHTNQITTIEGHNYIGVQAMNLMHAQEMLVDQNRANVNDRQGRSQRVVLNEHDLYNPQDGFSWYPGYQTEPYRFHLPGQGSRQRSYSESLLVRFGSYLHENGLLGENSGLFNNVEIPEESGRNWRYLDFRNLPNNVGPSTRPDGSGYQIPRGMPIRMSYNSNQIGYQS
ncbi:hypothetical protein F5Y13DRAFT_202085 [Hypoxylon sp. FL1857]|nr:hypothetical protein F5Y13DRAFT_202085 [Hypoxylon sp. FL1857]